MIAPRFFFALSLLLVAAGCAESTTTEDSSDSAAAESAGADQVPAEIAAMEGLTLVNLERIPLKDGNGGSVQSDGAVYVNLETPITMANGSSASFMSCDLSIGHPEYFEEKTTDLTDDDDFTVFGVTRFEEQGTSTATFMLESQRSQDGESQKMMLQCSIGGLNPLSYLSLSSMVLRKDAH